MHRQSAYLRNASTRLEFVNIADTAMIGTTGSAPTSGYQHQRHQRPRAIAGDAANDRGEQRNGRHVNQVPERNVSEAGEEVHDRLRVIAVAASRTYWWGSSPIISVVLARAWRQLRSHPAPPHRSEIPPRSRHVPPQSSRRRAPALARRRAS